VRRAEEAFAGCRRVPRQMRELFESGPTIEERHSQDLANIRCFYENEQERVAFAKNLSAAGGGGILAGWNMHRRMQRFLKSG
jgi:predicted outer membrane repeat protein